MFSKYRVMNRKLSELRVLYPKTLTIRRAVDCRAYARTMRAEAARMTVNSQGKADRERLAEMYEEKMAMLVGLVLNERKSQAGR